MPYWRSLLRTGLSPADVKERLSALTLAPENAYHGLPLRKGKSRYAAATADDGYEFVGSVSERDFRLNRRSPFDAAFRPEMHGSIAPISGGSRIRLTLRLPWLAAVAATTIAAACALGPFVVGASSWPPGIEHLLFVVVVASMMAGGFVQDAVGNRRRLIELLEATPESSPSPPPPTVSR